MLEKDSDILKELYKKCKDAKKSEDRQRTNLSATTLQQNTLKNKIQI